MYSIEFRDIMYVLSVASERSFSRAAERNFISQPTLSKAVRKVETELGVAIFNRREIPLELTEDGATIIEYFERLLAVEDQLAAFCNSRGQQKESDLRIGASSYFCTHILPPIIEDFSAEQPNLKVKLIETNDQDLREYLRAGAVDMGISVEMDILPNQESFVLGYEHILLAVPKHFAVNERVADFALNYEDIRSEKFLDTEIPAVPLSEFAEEPFLFLKGGNDMCVRGYRVCRDAGFEPRIVMELDQLMTAYYLAEAGRGATFVRATLPVYMGESQQLYFYKIDHPDMRRQIRLFRGKTKIKSEIQERFFSFVQESFQ